MFNSKKIMSFLFAAVITVLSFANISVVSAANYPSYATPPGVRVVNLPTYTAQAYHDEAYNLFKQGRWPAFWGKYGNPVMGEDREIIVNGTIEKIYKDDSSPFFAKYRVITLVGGVTCTLTEPAAKQLVVGQQVSLRGCPQIDERIGGAFGVSMMNGVKLYDGKPITEEVKPMRPAKKWYI